MATPDFLFATRATKHSNRPVETLTPLAKAFGDRDIHHKIANDDFPKLVEHIFTDAKYAGKTLAICWHHGNIPELAQGIAAKARNAANLKATIPIRWEGAVFDRVWILTFENDGNAAFANLPQRLLFGDSKN
ncbi:MAG: hypothetical protein HYR84_13625 [Planctomycetes bacterium]|nr:hypothetical protein [Planctomycetota bacterium]